MKYGYGVIKMEGNGEITWEEYEKEPRIVKVRVFNKKSDRDNAVKLEYEKLRREGHSRNTISTFITRG